MTGCCGGGEVWLDPAELDRTATLLGEQAARINETTTGLTSCCGSGLGWVDEALSAVAAEAGRVAAAYLVEAGDLTHRASEVVLEEASATTSGTTATPTVVGESMTVTATTGTTAWTTSSIGDTGSVIPIGAKSGLETMQPGEMGYLGGLEGLVASTLAGHSPQGSGVPNSGLGDLLGVARSQGDQGATWFAPSGTHVEGGQYVDGSGNSGDITHVQPDFNDPNSNVVQP